MQTRRRKEITVVHIVFHTNAPSMSGIDMSLSTVSGVTLPPYWMRIASAAAAEYVLANHDRMYLHTQSGRV